MRLYHLGDQGEPVRDIQGRLHALGHDTGDDPVAFFGPGTAAAVEAFQLTRGLPQDGIVGPETWRTLVDAGFGLGDRMLYHRVPMMRGDDIAEVQRRLNSLGFDAGKVDGSFGPDTLAAVLDFQSNRRMAEDGIVGRKVVAELDLMARATAKPGREAVRERQWLAALPTHIAGQRIYVDAFCRNEEEAEQCWEAALEFATTVQRLGAHPLLSRSADTAPNETVRALRANRLDADFVVSFTHHLSDERSAVLYFASHHSHSAAGEKVATVVAHSLGLPSEGRAIPILRDTRPPAVVISARPMGASLGRRTADAIVGLLAAPRQSEDDHR